MRPNPRFDTVSAGAQATRGGDELITVEYRGPAELAGFGPHDWSRLLGLVRIAPSGALDGGAAVPAIDVAAAPLGEAATLFEVWRSTGPLKDGVDGRVRHRANESVLFGSVQVEEGEAPAQCPQGTPLKWATALAYAEVFRCLEARGFPYLWRVWNYLPEINRETAGMERYRQFNLARQQAFSAAGRDVASHVPAACALGTAADSPLVVYFLAARRAGLPIENPRQVAAYRYPREYGPASPTFSRATLSSGASGATLLVSGTSSIVGHRTVHAGDVVAQTRETLANIRALLSEASRRAAGVKFALEQLAYKVYLRYEKDLRACAGELRRVLGPEVPIVYLRADVCRAELLVEIEAVGSCPRIAKA
jgi:chorismate lyase/3-hydroxybenzoate synthase